MMMKYEEIEPSSAIEIRNALRRRRLAVENRHTETEAAQVAEMSDGVNDAPKNDVKEDTQSTVALMVFGGLVLMVIIGLNVMMRMQLTKSLRGSIKGELQHQAKHRFKVDELEQYDDDESEETKRRRDTVKLAFLHAWDGYRQYAWGKDTLFPISRTGKDDFLGMAISIIDSMDTALIMGFNDIFEEDYRWVMANLKFGTQENINVFETTIRVIGGLLSAYELSGREGLLHLAEDCAQRLLPAFETPTGVPYGTIDLPTGITFNPSWISQLSSAAEAGTIQLEFRLLSHYTGKPIYKDVVDKVSRFFEKMQIENDGDMTYDGLFAMFLSPLNGYSPYTGMVTFGANGDSMYEYFLKGFLQTDRTEPWLLDMYIRAMDGMIKHLLHRTRGILKLMYVAELNLGEKDQPIPKMDHLVCFVPGMLALGAKYAVGLDSPKGKEHLYYAKEIMRTCYLMYGTMPLGLAPEIVHLNQPGKPELMAKKGAHHCLLRPETVESLFVLWRITKDPMYRDWGWKIMTKINQHAKIASGGYSGIEDVTKLYPTYNDKMDSFFVAETLKYLYLLFSPDHVIPLNEFVFNTEAHPMPIFTW